MRGALELNDPLTPPILPSTLSPPDITMRPWRKGFDGVFPGELTGRAIPREHAQEILPATPKRTI
jgi:hypothetical protein